MATESNIEEESISDENEELLHEGKSSKITPTKQYLHVLPFHVLGLVKTNVTIVSSTHCSAPSAWWVIGNIIGFRKF